jgi:hypothetical protein
VKAVGALTMALDVRRGIHAFIFFISVTLGSASPRERITPFFQPPPQYSNDFGSYRSPLEFYDGRKVKSAADWQERRKEILKTWTEFLGPWQPLIEKPQIEWLSKTNRESFVQHRVRLEIAKGLNGEGYILVPNSKGPFPAVVVPFYEPETSIGLKGKFRDFGLQLAKRGFVALCLGSPGGDSRQPDTASARCQPLLFLGYVAANCLNALASMPEVDAKRIGIVGHSYGGKWAMFGSCFYEKFACAVWSDPGIVFDEARPNVNYWEPWYIGEESGKKRKPGVPTADNPRTGPYRKLIETGHDLHEVHALMAPRPFLVSGGSEDPPERWRALNHSVAVNKLLGFTNRVAMTNRPNHDPSDESNEQLYAFFEHFLKER